jgi:hypothetical protein
MLVVYLLSFLPKGATRFKYLGLLYSDTHKEVITMDTKQKLEERVKQYGTSMKEGISKRLPDDDTRNAIYLGSAVAGAGLVLAGAGRGIDAMGAVDLGGYPGLYTAVGIPAVLKMMTYFTFSPKEIPGYAAYGAGIALAHADQWMPDVYNYFF